MTFLLFLLSSISLANPSKMEKLEGEIALSHTLQTKLVEQGRELYEAADRMAEHDAACFPENLEMKKQSLGAANTWIAATWRYKKDANTRLCQKAVLTYFACQAALSCEEIIANMKDEAQWCAPAHNGAAGQCGR